ncbi:hypothetical protein E2C01_038013 [Portunus trituberculatus]|uniref:Uncharacterized protein n=1 Tax=Portunus trituberculatus TaxID=210409 RepID=A0A5B7F9P2_PORTR|nr:hypothetical protein [Portunus trituberculatus]
MRGWSGAADPRHPTLSFTISPSHTGTDDHLTLFISTSHTQVRARYQITYIKLARNNKEQEKK